MSKLRSYLGLPVSLALFPKAIFHPPPLQKVAVYNSLQSSPTLPSRFSLLSWNVQYCASRAYHFFYDGGPDVHASRTTVEKTINQVGSFLQEHQFDIVLLQEVDRNAKRTQQIDQVQALRAVVPQNSAAQATYFRSPFVPIPIQNPIGRVHTVLLTLSRYHIKKAYRHQLALLNESSFRQAFNLKRAILETEYQTATGPLFVANIHLSAFSFGDGTLHKQVQQLEEWIQSRPPNSRWIIAGDFNLLPLGDDPQRLLTPNEYEHASTNPLHKLLPKHNSVFPSTIENRTYLPFGHEKPDRTLDYILFSDGLEVEESKIHSHILCSDHIPISARFRIVDIAQ